jgi:23S rRNA (uracil-5-)-methyltransferase RumA
MATPQCPHFNECGGCSFQHVDYSTQLENKRKALESATGFKEIKVISGKEYGYRNRMDFIFHPHGIGFRKKRRWGEIVDIKHCAISNEGINSIVPEIRDFFAGADVFRVGKNSGTFRYAVIRAPRGGSSVSFVLNSESTKIKEAVEKIKEFAEKTSTSNVIVTYVQPNTDTSISDDFFAVKGTDMIKETLLGKEFLYSVQGFFQNNTDMAEKMQEYVRNLLKNYETKDAHLLDLYAGVGTFGIINADLFYDVTIIESVPQCIDAAKINLANNSISNAKAIVLDAKQLKKVELAKPLFVITDPPRSGMHPKTIEQLKALKPEVIIYVSCNPQQLGKDILKFKGYKVKSAAMLDLFPQTPHVEAVVELVKGQV